MSTHSARRGTCLDSLHLSAAVRLSRYGLDLPSTPPSQSTHSVSNLKSHTSHKQDQRPQRPHCIRSRSLDCFRSTHDHSYYNHHSAMPRLQSLPSSTTCACALGTRLRYTRHLVRITHRNHKHAFRVPGFRPSLTVEMPHLRAGS
jgi:hypothetical protein